MTPALLMDLVFEQSRAAQVVVARHPAVQVHPWEAQCLASVTLQMYDTLKGYWNDWLQNARSQGIEVGSAREDRTCVLDAFDAWLNLASTVQTVVQAVSSRTLDESNAGYQQRKFRRVPSGADSRGV